MAKKKEKLSLEELLEQAIVKEEDRPYEVPENWVWTRLDNVAEYKKGPFGSAITKAMFVPKGENTYKIYEQGNAIRKDKNYGSYYISEEKYQKLKGFTVYPNDLIVSCAGTVGEVYQLPEDIEKGIINQALMRIKVSEKVNLKYYLLYFSESLKIDITGKSKGTAIKNIPPFAILKNMSFPLPSIVEQQRIVDIIEQQFEKLDTAKELVQNALDSFENRKTAILHKAFTGELTAKWREENGVSLDDWEEKELKELCTVNPKRVDTKDIGDDIDVTFVPMTSVSDKLGIIEKPIIKKLREVKKGYTNFCKDDVLFAKITPCMENGKSAIVGKLINNIGFGSTEFHVLRCSDKLDKKYLHNLVRWQMFLDEAKAVMTGAVGQQRVPKSFLDEYVLNVPTMEEQQEIVRVLENLLDNEQRAKELCDVIEKIDLMKKAILSRAFRGELGTNNSNEESAIELLKDILNEQDK